MLTMVHARPKLWFFIFTSVRSRSLKCSPDERQQFWTVANCFCCCQEIFNMFSHFTATRKTVKTVGRFERTLIRGKKTKKTNTFSYMYAYSQTCTVSYVLNTVNRRPFATAATIHWQCGLFVTESYYSTKRYQFTFWGWKNQKELFNVRGNKQTWIALRHVHATWTPRVFCCYLFVCFFFKQAENGNVEPNGIPTLDCPWSRFPYLLIDRKRQPCLPLRSLALSLPTPSNVVSEHLPTRRIFVWAAALCDEY